MKTMLLNPATWDLTVDVAGNIAIAENPYALAQNAASAIKLFQGEQWFNTTIGVPYFSKIFGKTPNVPLMKTMFAQAAMTVPGVVKAVVFITAIKDRHVSGQVQVTDASGVTTAAAF